MHCAAPFAPACAGCGAELPDEARFCPSCAHPVESAESRDPRAYTPKHLADKILQSKSALEGERKQVTVLFADVKGSMELAEEIDPEAWHSILDRFFHILADGIHRFEGTVNQYTGDGIMALFGAPIAHEDHSQRACYAALQLREDLQTYAREVKREHGLNFSTRMGINSGEVVVGKIGDDLRMDYTAQGPSVGLAARMEELASPDTVYLTGNTADLVSGYFDLEDLGPFTVKGVTDPVPVFQLEGAGAVRTRFDVSRARGLTRFVGRDDDMNTLESALVRAREGNGSVVGIVADAGTGKSRLCFEFVERCRAEGLNVLEGRAVAHGKSIPYLPMLQAFRQYFGITEGDTDLSSREKIAGRLILIDESFREVLPVLFDFFGVPDPDRPVPPMDSDARQRQIFAVLRRIVQTGATFDVAIALIEDLHWIDGGSEALLEQWVDAIGGTNSLLVVNFRPEYHAGWMKKSYYHQLPLSPLGPDAIRELLDDLLGSDPSISGLAEVIHERTAGNPFFTEEVVQGLIEAGNLEGSRGDYRLVTPVDRLAVPRTVQSVLAARIDRLAEREKQVLQPAAVIGKEFQEPILERVAELTKTDLAESLHMLKDSEFIYEQSLYPIAEYAFKHPLTQEVALGSQLHDRRRRTHAAVAQALEEANAERLDDNAALIAHHWDEAGETLQAIVWHRRAAEWIAKHDYAEADTHWRRMLELSDSVPDESEAQRHGLKAREMLLSNGWRVGLPYEQSERLAAEGRQIAERLGDRRSLVGILIGLCAQRFLNGFPNRAMEPAEEALRIAEEIEDVGGQMEAMTVLIDTQFLAGHVEAALAGADRSIELADGDVTYGTDRFNVSLLGWTYGRKGWWGAWAGRGADATNAENEIGLKIVRDQNQTEVVGWIYGQYAQLEELTGESHQALSRGQQSLENAEKAGSPAGQVFGYAAIGHAFLILGQSADAIQALEQADALIRERHVFIHWRPICLALLAEAYVDGDPGRARACAGEAIHAAEVGGLRIYEGRGHLARARVLKHLDGLAARTEIESSLARAAALVEETGARALAPQVVEERGRVAALAGDAERATELLREAHALYVEVNATGHAGRLAKELKA
jgi:class 3 adenylate cyclase/tetratricopeptide (TPR) repeat protein